MALVGADVDLQLKASRHADMRRISDEGERAMRANCLAPLMT
ncbi:hypothetical protein SK803_30400 [Lentzea sp. BCCO 10_0856]|uniref:Uncharacterized protein n=1 Tax=Lentzea miocenica TaxID=3095431 RepID=A0ABU4T8Q4_9PSEU|nr:hypothetical protein [Lentzea sp. BCCO 10_0856]MDX8034552.1 hypothetical protein [Lentzea sp. BCCO 10_0856]